MYNLFVYGTLMTGYGNHRLLEDYEPVGTASTVEKYELRVSGIPFLGRKKGATVVKGEVYQVKAKDIEPIDNLEGHPVFYKRELIWVNIEGQEEPWQCWAYFCDTESGEVSNTGDYRNPFDEKAQEADPEIEEVPESLLSED